MVETILVADDEEEVRNRLKTIFEDQGHAVMTAVDGDDCLKKARGSSINLILLDISMPGTPVQQVVKQLPNKRIAFCTLLRLKGEEKQALLSQKNIVGFIQKPFSEEGVVTTVSKLLAEK